MVANYMKRPVFLFIVDREQGLVTLGFVRLADGPCTRGTASFTCVRKVQSTAFAHLWWITSQLCIARQSECHTPVFCGQQPR